MLQDEHGRTNVPLFIAMVRGWLPDDLDDNELSILQELANDEGVQPDEIATSLLKQKLAELSDVRELDVCVTLTDKGFQAVKDGEN